MVAKQGGPLVSGIFNLGRFRGDKEKCCVVPMDFFPMPPIDGKKPIMSVFAEDTIMIMPRARTRTLQPNSSTG
jgi:hypothetical protein